MEVEVASGWSWACSPSTPRSPCLMATTRLVAIHGKVALIERRLVGGGAPAQHRRQLQGGGSTAGTRGLAASVVCCPAAATCTASTNNFDLGGGRRGRQLQVPSSSSPSTTAGCIGGRWMRRTVDGGRRGGEEGPLGVSVSVVPCALPVRLPPPAPRRPPAH
ncbi:hypothetical protein EJB05_27476, partial [Eragrostis curvula]